MQPSLWLPLTEYALRSGMSISTLRRKIKSNTIPYKMEEGRYLIRLDEMESDPVPNVGYASSDAPRLPKPAVSQSDRELTSASLGSSKQEIDEIRDELRRSQDENSLRWRALEARVAGLARKLDLYAEQMAEVKMLVKIFEEKLDARS